MARVTSSLHRLGSSSSVLQSSSSHARRETDQTWRGWYKTVRWQRLRQEVLKRDAWRCQKTNILVIGGKAAPTSAVVDHIIPHRGDPVLFWDINNLQTVSKAYHDGEKQRLENSTNY